VLVEVDGRLDLLRRYVGELLVLRRAQARRVRRLAAAHGVELLLLLGRQRTVELGQRGAHEV
jgi:hypothetical protein